MICLLLAVWLAWQTVSPEALQHLQAGAEADKQRQFDVAITEFKKVTELEPKFADGFVNSSPDGCIKMKDRQPSGGGL